MKRTSKAILVSSFSVALVLGLAGCSSSSEVPEEVAVVEEDLSTKNTEETTDDSLAETSADSGSDSTSDSSAVTVAI